MAEITITTANFEAEVSHGAVMLDFFGTWCAPCKAIAPIVSQLATTYMAKGLKVGTINVEQEPDLAARFRIVGVPTLLFLKDGKVADQLVGGQSATAIEQKVKRLIGAA